MSVVGSHRARVFFAGVFTFLCFVSAAIPAAEAAPQEEKPAKADTTTDKPSEKRRDSDYLRLTRDEKDVPISLESSIVTLAGKGRGSARWTVDLVAAVHVGEKQYYDELNRRFADYDVVLYELVAPKGTRIPKGAKAKSNHPITVLQTLMKSALGLEFQLECIDYTKKNFVHADMSDREFAAAMAKRGDSVWTVMGRMIQYAVSQSGEGTGPSDAEVIAALFNKNRTLAMKRIMATQFCDMDGTIAALEGPDGSAVVADRNRVAIQVLQEQVKKGKKKIAIFYGAGHMLDFQKRLKSDFGLEPIRSRWITAWDMKDAKVAPAERKPAAVQ